MFLNASNELPTSTDTQRAFADKHHPHFGSLETGILRNGQRTDRPVPDQLSAGQIAT